MRTEQFARLENIAQHNIKLWNSYKTGFHLNSDILAIEAKSSQLSASAGGLKSLKALTRGRFERIVTTGDHYSMFHPQHMERWLNSACTFIQAACS
jgi:hypothetical protein